MNGRWEIRKRLGVVEEERKVSEGNKEERGKGSEKELERKMKEKRMKEKE
jgi:hypothetical protein